MREQILGKSAWNFCKLSFAVLLLLLPGISGAQNMVSYGVTFGQPQDNNGPCVGKGMCKESSDIGTNGVYASEPEEVTVTFQLSPDNPNVLMLSFSMSELTAKQPDKAGDFVNGGSYQFDAPFSLSSSLFGALNLPPNSIILPSSQSNIAINGDFVTDFIIYSHD